MSQRQRYASAALWPQTHKALRLLSFTQNRPVTELAEEAVQLLQAKYAAQGEPAEAA